MDNFLILKTLDKAARRIENTEALENISGDILSSKSIVLNFPSFMDGRAYSQARRLRRAGYKGTLIAAGDVRADQARQYARVGFSAIFSKNNFDGAISQNDLTRFTDHYQSSASDEQSIYHKRFPNTAAKESGGGAF